MEFLGVVEGITADGRALVKCDSLPNLGTTIFDGERNRVGTVKRILGPVDCPYASVSGENVRPGLKGKKLFYNQGGQDGRNKKKGRKY